MNILMSFVRRLELDHMSHAGPRLMPAPAATPFTAAITGLSSRHVATARRPTQPRCSRRSFRAGGFASPLPPLLRSTTEQKPSADAGEDHSPKGSSDWARTIASCLALLKPATALATTLCFRVPAVV